LVSLGVVIALAMAGPEVWNRFNSISKSSLTGATSSEAEWSAESRVILWGVCVQMVAESPLVGKGPDHFPKIIQRYETGNDVFPRFPEGKEAHTLWLQIAAELGIPGVVFLASYYVLTVAGLWKYCRLDNSDSRGLTPGATARMVIAAMVGFIVSAQFVTLEGLELPYYVALVGLGSLKLSSTLEAFDDASEPYEAESSYESSIPAEYAAV
jgi:O-antigen ligase